jgi:tetratricopeptide (TPR) repeat protein
VPYTTVSLDPLNIEDSGLLVSSLLEIEDLPERVRDLILEKSEGNPFFVEEVIRSLIDSRLIVQQDHHWHATQEIGTIGVPGTLAGVITARLDRLDPETKRVAQAASVIGRDFSPTLLYEVLDNPLDLTRPLQELGSRGIIREKPQNSHAVYTFKHALTQETVYGSILHSKKRIYHGKVAQTLQQVNPEGVNAIAWHYLEANEPLQALPFILDSGDRAARAYSTAEARQYYSKALAILNDHPDPLLSRRAFEGLGSALTFSNNLTAAVDNYQSMVQLGQQINDAPMQISALNKMSDVIAMRLGEFPKADDYLSTAERLAREVNDLPGLSELYWIRCGICTTTGDFDTAVKYLDESVQIGRNLNLREQIAGSLAHIAGTLTLMARFDEAIQAANEAYDLSMELGIKVDMAQMQTLAWPFIYLHQGNLDQAEEIAEKGVTLSKDIGVSFLESIGATTLGIIKDSRGEYDQALNHFKRALQSGQDSQVSWVVVMALGGLGAVYLEISESFLDQTGELHAQALKMMEHPAAMMGGGTAWRHVGYSFLNRGQIGKAIELFEKGLNTPTPLVVLNKPWFLLGLAEAALLEQEIELADSYLKTAEQYIRRQKLRFFEPHLASQQGYIALAKKDWEEANDSFNRSLQIAIPRENRPLVLDAYIGNARAFAGLGMAGQAENSYHLAKQTGEAISRLFVDPVHRQYYEARIHKGFEDGYRQIQLID